MQVQWKCFSKMAGETGCGAMEPVFFLPCVCICICHALVHMRKMQTQAQENENVSISCDSACACIYICITVVRTHIFVRLHLHRTCEPGLNLLVTKLACNVGQGDLSRKNLSNFSIYLDY